MSAIQKDMYFRVKEANQPYKGIRYFRFNPTTENVIQVCLHPGDAKKGKANTIGVYLIHRITFLSNYLTFYVEPCTKAKYDKAFDKVITARNEYPIRP